MGKIETLFHRLIIIASLFLMALSLGSLADAGQVRVLSPLIGGVCDDCSGAVTFAFHMEDNDSTPDVTIGTPCGCSDGDTVGAEVGSPAFSAAQASDGTYSLQINAKDESYNFTLSAYDLADIRDIKITFDIWITTLATGGNQLGFIYISDDADNNLALFVDDDGINANHESGATSDYIETAALGTGSWLSCEYQAIHATAGNDHYINCTGVSPVTEDDDFVLYDGDGTGTLVMGDQTGDDDTPDLFLDNVKIYTASDIF